MSSRPAERELTRRDVLAAGLAAAGLAATAGNAGAGALTACTAFSEEGDYAPFKMGLQSFSLRGYTTGDHADLAKALSVTRDLGLHFWEAFPGHIRQTDDPEKIKAIKDQFEAASVRLSGYGVVHLGSDEAANRKLFEFAKAMGLEYLSVDPHPDVFTLMDKLVEEYDMPIGIHNHGPGHRYALIDTIAGAIKNHSPKIGCCIDTGHFLRSKEDPARAVEVFGKRVYGVHLKDVKNAETFTILGQGDLHIADLLKALAANQYAHCLAIEYEERPEHPAQDIKTCLGEVRQVIEAIKPK
jgi:sugar phosphate isomerase/epimerase